MIIQAVLGQLDRLGEAVSQRVHLHLPPVVLTLSSQPDEGLTWRSAVSVLENIIPAAPHCHTPLLPDHLDLVQHGGGQLRLVPRHHQHGTGRGAGVVLVTFRSINIFYQ